MPLEARHIGQILQQQVERLESQQTLGVQPRVGPLLAVGDRVDRFETLLVDEGVDEGVDKGHQRTQAIAGPIPVRARHDKGRRPGNLHPGAPGTTPKKRWSPGSRAFEPAHPIRSETERP